MGRATKLYQRLDALEVSLSKQLKRQLTRCVAGRKELVFSANEFLPKDWPKSLATGIADSLLDQVEKIRGLREKVEEPFDGSLANRFRESCRRWADVSDSQVPRAAVAGRDRIPRIKEADLTWHPAIQRVGQES